MKDHLVRTGPPLPQHLQRIHDHLKKLGRDHATLKSRMRTPTVPVYDPDFPLDAVNGQIALQGGQPFYYWDGAWHPMSGGSSAPDLSQVARRYHMPPGYVFIPTEYEQSPGWWRWPGGMVVKRAAFNCSNEDFGVKAFSSRSSASDSQAAANWAAAANSFYIDTDGLDLTNARYSVIFQVKVAFTHAGFLAIEGKDLGGTTRVNALLNSLNTDKAGTTYFVLLRSATAAWNPLTELDVRMFFTAGGTGTAWVDYVYLIPNHTPVTAFTEASPDWGIDLDTGWLGPTTTDEGSCGSAQGSAVSDTQLSGGPLDPATNYTSAGSEGGLWTNGGTTDPYWHTGAFWPVHSHLLRHWYIDVAITKPAGSDDYGFLTTYDDLTPVETFPIYLRDWGFAYAGPRTLQSHAMQQVALWRPDVAAYPGSAIFTPFNMYERAASWTGDSTNVMAGGTYKIRDSGHLEIDSFDPAE